MADVKPLKLVDQGGGAGRLEEFGAGDRVPAENLPATEWAAETVSQAEAEAGTATTRRAWTAQRVRQAIAAWWNGVSSAWGRGFVASANASAGRTALELGNAATRAVQTSPTDTTAGALMAVGAFGLGGENVLITNANLNTLSKTGFYMGQNLINAPLASGEWFYVLHQEHGWSGYSSQIAIDLISNTPKTYQRQKTAGTWYPWCEVFNTRNILGPVSRSAGIPTGAIIERGSNANGEYVRFADGTQICTNHFFSIPARSIANSSLFRTANVTWTFPANFIINPVCGGKPVLGDSAANGWFGLGNEADGSLTSTSFAIHGATPTSTSGIAALFAIGRWY